MFPSFSWLYLWRTGPVHKFQLWCWSQLSFAAYSFSTKAAWVVSHWWPAQFLRSVDRSLRYVSVRSSFLVYMWLARKTLSLANRLYLIYLALLFCFVFFCFLSFVLLLPNRETWSRDFFFLSNFLFIFCLSAWLQASELILLFLTS